MMSDFERDDMFEESTESYESTTGKPRKEKKSKEKKTKGKKVEGKLTIAFVALALMLITFVVLVVLENKMVNGGEKVNVVVAIAEVPEGVELTQTNMPTYFAIEERDKDDIPLSITTYDSGTPLIGKVTDRVIHTKEIITNECFYEKGFFDDIEDAVELSIDLGAIGQTVGGTLRPGDRVDIKAVIKLNKDSLLMNTQGQDGLVNISGESDELLSMDPAIKPIEGEVGSESADSNKISSKDALALGSDGLVQFAEDVEVSFGITGEYVSQVIAEDVIVVDVFNSGGETVQAVEAAGGSMVATVINVAVPSYMVDSILIAQAEGTITLSRVEDVEEVTEEVAGDGTGEVAGEGETVQTEGSEVPVDNGVTVVQ